MNKLSTAFAAMLSLSLGSGCIFIIDGDNSSPTITEASLLVNWNANTSGYEYDVIVRASDPDGDDLQLEIQYENLDTGELITLRTWDNGDGVWNLNGPYDLDPTASYSFLFTVRDYRGGSDSESVFVESTIYPPDPLQVRWSCDLVENNQLLFWVESDIYSEVGLVSAYADFYDSIGLVDGFEMQFDSLLGNEELWFFEDWAANVLIACDGYYEVEIGATDTRGNTTISTFTF